MSRNRQVYLVIGLAAVAMLGLIALQVYWIQSALTTNEERFNSQVAEALTAVNQQIEKQQTFYRSQAPASRDTLSDSAAFRRNLKSSVADIKQEKGITEDSLKNLLKPLKKLIDSNRTNAPDAAPEDEDKLDIEAPGSPDLSKPGIKDSILEAFNKGVFKVFEGVSVFRDLVKDLKRAGNQQDQRLKVDRLDSLVRKHLRSRGIESRYYMGILDDSGEGALLYAPSEVSDTALLESPHGTGLFSSNIFTSGYQLKVYFPEKQWVLLSRIKWIMASSLLFLLILVGSFAWISKHFFRQKQLSEIKTDFINNMTHELKTPISTISLATEALQDQQLNADSGQRQRFTQMISDENRRLSHQVERVLQMAKLEKGTFQLKQEQLNVNQLLEGVVQNVRFRVEEQGGALRLQQKAERSLVTGDEVHLTNVFQNLLDNAIKYADGPPDITVRVGQYLQQLRVEVSDKGIGMGSDEQKHIFDKFYRVSNGNVHNVKGFGLGLSYVATIVQAHAGDIRVSSSKGRGTTFYLYLPFAQDYTAAKA